MTGRFATAAKSAKRSGVAAKSKTTSRRNFFGTFGTFGIYSLGEGTRAWSQSGSTRSPVPPSGETLPNPPNAPNRPAFGRFEFGTCCKPVPNGAKSLQNRGWLL